MLISEAQMIDIKEVLEDWYGVRVPFKLLTELLTAEPGLEMMIAENGFDTVCRECTLDAVCLKVTGGRHWPIGMTPADERQETFRIFRDNAERFGVELVIRSTWFDNLS